MNIYFARPISQYNNKQDIRDIEMLNKMGFTVVNPNKEELADQYKIKGMDAFAGVVAECDALVFRSFVGGKIGAGVMREIQWALESNKPVIELPNITEDRFLSVDDTRTYLKLLGQR